jgi:2'-5' RNA ligase
VATHALLALPPFSVEEFALYSSVRTSAGSRYRIEASYPLSPP